MKMRTGLLVAAAPAAAVVGNALLTGYLLNRVKPVPISPLPWPALEKVDGKRDAREAVAG